jgi:hypothetical protein
MHMVDLIFSFSFSFCSISGKIDRYEQINEVMSIYSKASGELLDPDHYIRARNNPSIPDQARGR